MDDAWTFLVAVFVDIVHIELFSKKCIPLDCDHCIFFAIYILSIDVDLRSVECCFSDILCEWDVQFFEHLTDIFFCLIPYFRFTDVFFSIIRIPFGQMIGYIFLNAKNLQAVLSKCDTVFEFFDHLVWSYDQMSLRDCKLTNSCQTMHLTGVLITEQCGCFAVTKRQVTVAVLFCFVYIVLEWTCHRTESIYFFVFLFVTKNEHTVFVMIPVSGDLVEVALCHQRSFCSYVATFCLLIFDPSLQFLHHDNTVWHDQWKSLSDYIYSCKNFHLTAKFIVVTFFSFFHLLQMFFQFIFGCIGCSVDTCQHCVLFASSPVSTGRRKKFECFYAFYAHKVWSCAEICPVTL